MSDPYGPPNRRKFLGLATCAIGGGVGVVAAVPLVRLVLDPVGKETVTSPRAPIDIGPASRFGAQPTKVELVAPVIKDAWAAARDVVLGAAYIRVRPASEVLGKSVSTNEQLFAKQGESVIEACSAVCPHLGCAVSFDGGANNFLCPCHDSRFAIDGAKMSGPSERGLDRLPLQIKDGRLFLTWQRYRLGSTKQEPV